MQERHWSWVGGQTEKVRNRVLQEVEQWKYTVSGCAGRICCHCDRNSESVYLLFVYNIMTTEFTEIKFIKTRKVFYFCICTAQASNSNNNFILTLNSLQMVYEWELHRLPVLHEHSLPLFVHTKKWWWTVIIQIDSSCAYEKNVFLKSVGMSAVIIKKKYVIWYTETPELLVTAHLNGYCIQPRKSVKVIHLLGPLVQILLYWGEVFLIYA